MTQTVFGQTDALALAVVAWLTAGTFTTLANVTPQPFCMEIAAERRFELVDDLPSIPVFTEPASVDIFPYLESSRRSEKSIAPVFISEYAIHVFIQQQVIGAPDEEAQCALLTQLRSQIIEGLKVMSFSISDAVHPSPTKVIPVEFQNLDQGFRGKGLYSLKRLTDDHVYESDTIVIFKAAA